MDPYRTGLDDSFRVFPQFDDPQYADMVRSRHRLGDVAASVFPGESIEARFVRALAARRTVNIKEVLESFEFFYRVRRRVRQPVLVDLCCGHGLTGVIFAMLERRVEQVILVDHSRPNSFDDVLSAAVEVAPWVAPKVEYRELPIATAAAHVPSGAAILGVHACGPMTDQCIDAAVAIGGPVALMPCCYRAALRDGPRGLLVALGAETAIDIHRTYRLEAAGFHVDWAAIPAAITPMNRILIGWFPKLKSGV